MSPLMAARTAGCDTVEELEAKCDAESLAHALPSEIAARRAAELAAEAAARAEAAALKARKDDAARRDALASIEALTARITEYEARLAGLADREAFCRRQIQAALVTPGMHIRPDDVIQSFAVELAALPVWRRELPEAIATVREQRNDKQRRLRALQGE